MVKKKSKKDIPLYQRLAFWRVLVIILIIILLLVVFPDGKSSSDDNILSEEMIKARAIKFLEGSMGPDTIVIVHQVTDVGQVYSLSVTVGNESATLYSSKDGRYLFPGAFDVGEVIPTAATYAIGGGERTTVSIDDDAILGDVSAPVTIIEFSDYECPMCGRFWETTFHELKQEYIDTGKVRFIFRDFALSYHKYAQKAAEASECAADQGKFWEYHDKLFANQKSFSDQIFVQFASELGMDVGEFTICLNSRKYEQEVLDDFDAGVAAGIQGTPSFYVNGIPLVGAQPFEAFKEVIDAELGQ